MPCPPPVASTHQRVRLSRRGDHFGVRRLVNRAAARFILRSRSAGSKGRRFVWGEACLACLPPRSPRISHGRGAACESPYRAIHPEIPQCGSEGLRPSLPRRQQHATPARTRWSQRKSGLSICGGQLQLSPVAPAFEFVFEFVAAACFFFLGGRLCCCPFRKLRIPVLHFACAAASRAANV